MRLRNANDVGAIHSEIGARCDAGYVTVEVRCLLHLGEAQAGHPHNNRRDQPHDRASHVFVSLADATHDFASTFVVERRRVMDGIQGFGNLWGVTAVGQEDDITVVTLTRMV
jgi:hypothetical protein